MSRLIRHTARAICALAVLALLAGPAAAQRRAVPRHGPPPQTHVFRGHVFIGGYFYDPFWGPYPWWPRTAYPYWYFPMYDRRGELHLKVRPRETAVYVDGFYAGIVDDFDGVFQSLPLPPGGHDITLFLQGSRTAQFHVYLGPASSIDIHHTMVPLTSGAFSEPPPVAPPVPPPPAGSYSLPRTPPRVTPPAAAPPPADARGFGTLELQIQPPDADVTIDGQRWLTSDHGRFVVQVPAGMHRVVIEKRGYQAYSADVDVRDGQSTPLNVSLMASR